MWHLLFQNYLINGRNIGLPKISIGTHVCKVHQSITVHILVYMNYKNNMNVPQVYVSVCNIVLSIFEYQPIEYVPSIQCVTLPL